MEAIKPKITIFLYSLGGGGAERIVSILLRHLSQKFDITLVLMNTAIVYDIPSTIPIHYLETSIASENPFFKFVKLPILAFRYARFCNHHQISLSFSLMNRPNYINVLSKFFGNRSRIMISERGTPSRQYPSNSLQGKINRWLIRWLYPKADVITTNSEGSRQDLEKYFHISKPIRVLYNLFEISNVQRKIEPASKPIKLISIGRLDQGKNHILLLQMLSKIKRNDVHLTIAGEGPLKASLEQSINDLNLKGQVTLTGFIANPFDYLLISDVFLFSSRHEGFPNVLVEALSCGCAVISTDCPSGPREILSPDISADSISLSTVEYAPYGILVPIDNIDLIGEALNSLLEHPLMLESYKQKGHQRANDFNVQTILPFYEKILMENSK